MTDEFRKVGNLKVLYDQSDNYTLNTTHQIFSQFFLNLSHLLSFKFHYQKNINNLTLSHSQSHPIINFNSFLSNQQNLSSIPFSFRSITDIKPLLIPRQKKSPLLLILNKKTLCQKKIQLKINIYIENLKLSFLNFAHVFNTFSLRFIINILAAKYFLKKREKAS